MTWEWAPIGVLFTMILALFGYIWQTARGVDARMSKLEEMMGKAETMLEPLWEVCKAALPKVLKLHSSPDPLWEALNCEVSEEKIDRTIERVRLEMEAAADNGDDSRTLAAALAIWALKVRKLKIK